MKTIFVFLILAVLTSCASSPEGTYTFTVLKDYPNHFVLYNTKVVVDSDTINYGNSKIKILDIKTRRDSASPRINFHIWEAPTAVPNTVVLLFGGLKHPHFTLNSVAHRLTNMGYNCIFLDSRGYGSNDNLSKTFGTIESDDIDLTITAYKQSYKIDTLNVIIFSTSMGGVPAIEYAKTNPNVKALIFESMIYDNIETIDNYLNFFERTYFNIAYSGIKRKMSKINPKNTFLELNPMLALYFFWSSEDKLADKKVIESIKKVTNNGKRVVQYTIVPNGTHAIRVGYNLTQDEFDTYLDEISKIVEDNFAKVNVE